MVEESTESIPLTTLEVVHFIKTKGIYSGLLNQLSKQKEEAVKKDILEFIAFLLENDTDDINPIMKQVFEKAGSTSIFF